MGTDKRARQKAARQARLQHELEQERRAANFRRMRLLAGGVVILLLIVFLVSRGDDDSGEVATDGTSTTALDSSPTTTVPQPFAYGSGECAPEEGAEERKTSFDDAPSLCIDPDNKEYRAVVETTLGTFIINLAADKAPGTVNNFVNLARWNYYDGIIFHRVIDGFVIQAGDPQPEPDGTGGPGYQFGDELPASVDEYVEGSVAMANAGPASNGSQFFVYFGPNPLPGPSFSLFGQVTADTLDVARDILTTETDERDRPVTPVEIIDITIEERETGAE